MSARDRLATVLAPDVLDAIVDLVDERVTAVLRPPEDTYGGSPWLTLDNAADYLKISTRTLERQIAAGRIDSATIGRRRLVHRDSLDALAKAATREDVTPATPPRRRARTLDPARAEA